MIGDSLTYCYGITRTKSFSYLLSKNFSFNVINKGINGDTTASMLNRLYEDVTSKNPAYIFIMGGTNDLLCGRKNKSICDNIEEMIIECKKCTDKIFLGIPPYLIKEKASILFSPCDFYDYAEKSLPALKNNLLELCKKYSIHPINLFDLSMNTIMTSNQKIYIDGIHFNDHGNELVYNQMVKILHELNLF